MILSCLALPQHPKGLGVLEVLVLPWLLCFQPHRADHEYPLDQDLPFLLCLQESLCCLSSLDLHVAQPLLWVQEVPLHPSFPWLQQALELQGCLGVPGFLSLLGAPGVHCDQAGQDPPLCLHLLFHLGLLHLLGSHQGPCHQGHPCILVVQFSPACPSVHLCRSFLPSQGHPSVRRIQFLPSLLSALGHPWDQGIRSDLQYLGRPVVPSAQGNLAHPCSPLHPSALGIPWDQVDLQSPGSSSCSTRHRLRVS